jgi:hypothetical protein
MDLLDETNELIDRRQNQRPVFILVLCILTWAACGLGLISGLIQLWSYSAFNSFTNNIGNKAFGDNYNALTFWSAIATFVSSVMCALGAFFMFKLKKIGFFIYLFGQILMMSYTVYSSLAIKVPGMGGFFTSIGLIALIFPIAFIIMYGVNYKYLK